MSSSRLNLELNPSASVSIQDHEQPPSFLVEAPMRGATFSSVKVSAGNLPGAHAFLCSVLIDGEKDAQIGEQAAAELRQIGLFARADEMPQAVTYRFPLRDPEAWDKLLSRPGMDCTRGRPAHLDAPYLPAEWQDQALRYELHHHGSVWAPVRVANGAEFDGCGYDVCDETRQPEMSLDTETTRTHFEREGFAILENLLPTEHVEELDRYFQALAEQGFLSSDEVRGARRHFAHNHPVANFWHAQLNERVSQLAGRRTKPSYSFVSLYIAGGDLCWHTDRPPCEYTITLLLDYAPLAADGRSSWALKVKGRDGTIHTLHQRVGEALIFRGRELTHGRDVLPDGHRSASLLFHFVNEEYDGEIA
ncbi:MAG: hypothetical protein IPP82_00265 [Xanthomonadales bacterium]|nr:hypothetical protein [Xanthomonadales bacterium]